MLAKVLQIASDEGLLNIDDVSKNSDSFSRTIRGKIPFSMCRKRFRALMTEVSLITKLVGRCPYRRLQSEMLAKVQYLQGHGCGDGCRSKPSQG